MTRDVDLADTQDRVIDRRVAALSAAAPSSQMTVRKNSRAGTLVEAVTGGTGTIKLGPLVKHIAERQDALVALEATPATATSVAEDEATKVIAAIDASAPAKTDGTKAARDGVAADLDVDNSWIGRSDAR